MKKDYDKIERLYFKKGCTLMENREFKKAIKKFEKFIELRCARVIKEPRVFYFKGMCHAVLSYYEKDKKQKKVLFNQALIDFDLGIKESKTDWLYFKHICGGYLHICFLYMLVGKWKEVKKNVRIAYTESLKIRGDFSNPWQSSIQRLQNALFGNWFGGYRWDLCGIIVIVPDTRPKLDIKKSDTPSEVSAKIAKILMH